MREKKNLLFGRKPIPKEKIHQNRSCAFFLVGLEETERKETEG